MARVCILRARGDGVMLLRCFVRRAASGLALLESNLSAEAICARLEALELTHSSCDLNSQSETPTGLSWLSRDAQISNSRRGAAPESLVRHTSGFEFSEQALQVFGPVRILSWTRSDEARHLL